MSYFGLYERVTLHAEVTMNNIFKTGIAGIINASFASVNVGVVTTDLTMPPAGVSSKKPNRLDSGLAYLDC